MGKTRPTGIFRSRWGIKPTSAENSDSHSASKTSYPHITDDDTSQSDPNFQSDRLHFDGSNSVDLVKQRFDRRWQWMQTNKQLMHDLTSMAEEVGSCLDFTYGQSVDSTYAAYLRASFKSANLNGVRLGIPATEDVPQQAKIIHGVALWLRESMVKGETSDPGDRHSAELSKVIRRSELLSDSAGGASWTAEEKLKHRLTMIRSELDAIYELSKRGAAVVIEDSKRGEAETGRAEADKTAGSQMSVTPGPSDAGFWVKTALATAAAAATAYILYRHYGEEDTD